MLKIEINRHDRPYLLMRQPIWVLSLQNLGDHQILSNFGHAGFRVNSMSLSHSFFLTCPPMGTSFVGDLM